MEPSGSEVPNWLAVPGYRGKGDQLGPAAQGNHVLDFRYMEMTADPQGIN